MGSCTLVLIMILGALCVTQALRCNHCKRIDPDQPTCLPSDMEDRECGSGFDTCITIKMRPPAYGQVSRCAKSKECEGSLPREVERRCCKKDYCN